MKNLWKKILPHAVAVTLFFVATLLYFLPLFQGQGLAQHDIEQFKGSAKEVIDHREQYGEEPLWTNSMFGGMPAYLISTQYKGNLLAKLDRAFQLGKRPASFIFLTFIGFYILLLTLGVNPWLSIVGAFAYGLSSYFFIVIGAGHNAKIHAISYVAPMVAGFILAFKKKYLGGFALFALFLGLNLNAGHLQITYYAAFILIALGLAFLVEAIRKKEFIPFGKSVGVLLLAGILAVGANFSRLYFTWEQGNYSIRGASELTSEQENRTSGLDKEYATAWSYGVAETFNLLVPNLMGGSSMGDFGTDSHVYKYFIQNGVPASQAKAMAKQMPAYWGPQPMTSGPVYIGAIVIFLFVFSLFIIDDRIKWYLLGVTALGIMLAWGHNFMGLTNFFLNYIPGYNKFRTVSMILYIAEFTMPLLAFMGLRELYKETLTKERFMKAFKWSVGIVGGLCLIFVLFGKALFTFEAAVDAQYIAAGYPAAMFEALRLDRAALMRADAIRSLVFVLLSAGVLLTLYLKKLKLIHFVSILLVLVLADMWTVNRRYLNSSNFVASSKAEVPFKATLADRQILADKTPYFRVFNTTVSTFNDASTSYFHKSIGGYHGAKLRRYQELINYQIAQNNFDVLNMLNTRYFILGDESGIMAHYNPDALGNAWFVNQAMVVHSADEELAALSDFNPSETAILHAEFAKGIENYASETQSGDTIFLTDYRANRLVYHSELAQPKLAVFSDIYYPKGWLATVDGKPLDHLRVNYVLRGLMLPAGEHEVVFEFKPKMFKTGFTVDIISSILILLVSLGWVSRELYLFVGKEIKSV